MFGDDLFDNNFGFGSNDDSSMDTFGNLTDFGADFGPGSIDVDQDDLDQMAFLGGDFSNPQQLKHTVEMEPFSDLASLVRSVVRFFFGG